MEDLQALHDTIAGLAHSGEPSRIQMAAGLCDRLPPLTSETCYPVCHALFLTGFAYEGAGLTHEALPFYGRIADNPQAPPALAANATFRLGLLLESSGDVNGAIERYTSAAEQETETAFRALGAYHLAATLERIGCHREALDWADKGIAEIYGGVPSVLAFELKRATCLARLKRTSEIDVPVARRQLDALEELGWMEAASAVEHANDLSRARLFYERLLECEGLTEQLRSGALGRLRFLPIAGEGMMGAIYELVSVQNYQGVLQLVQAAEEAPPLVPSHPPTGELLKLWFARVIACAMLNLIDVPDEDLVGALPPPGAGLNESVAHLWIEAAFALERSGYPRAARLFYERLLEEPDVPPPMRTNLHFRLGVVLDTLLDWTHAVDQYRLAIASPYPFPEAQADAHIRLAEMFYTMEDYERARAEFETARDVPELGAARRAHAQLRYGSCLTREGETPAAIGELLKCRTPKYGAGSEIEVKADLLLAEIYEKSGDRTQARECFQRVIDHVVSEPLTKAAALTKLRLMKK